ncbi:MAG: glycosyltransferase family 2 protein [Chloroflexi bacterium]|nr:glycosyltransferase family 2 protein [Chloroflexota bacterium]MCL5026418.1 glycosyltransferase family 2 protein [Chloroflexota bacterium]
MAEQASAPTVDLTVSIISFNTKDLLVNCLESIYANTEGISFEVIVVDNASTDGSAEAVRTRFPQVRLIANDRNLYFTKAHNQAIGVSAGRYVLILNSDTILLPGTLEKMVQFMDAHPQAGAASCVFLNPDGTIWPSCWKFKTLSAVLWGLNIPLNLFPNARARTEPRMLDWDRTTLREVDVVVDAFMMVRRGAIEEVGTYDETLLLYATEDDFCLRLKSAGWKIYHVPEAKIIHINRGSVDQVRLLTIQSIYRRDTVRFLRKHHGFGIALIGNVIISLDLVIAGAYLFIKEMFQRDRGKRPERR